jgi:integral membrane protein
VFRTPASLYRVLAIAEVFSWTLLIAGLVIRAVGGPAVAVTIGGGIHGFVFLSYGATALIIALNNRWRIGPAVLAVGSAVVPYATLPVEMWLRRTGRLDGAWRLDETDDPRDRRPIDRLLRWFLRHAGILVALVVVAVVALYVTLLILGPPGGR